ncbi:extracellular solute-binding protein [Sphaerisporangium fuscum]|uniref:extracellular solute-binding protein n=1 Tax=Sphaerisporangium fuscum TaxID=2835868 RepID=UPI001BDBFBF6|nr:extracellular solute-binding protein [Sphaerisporangium fuscum]
MSRRRIGVAGLLASSVVALAACGGPSAVPGTTRAAAGRVTSAAPTSPSPSASATGRPSPTPKGLGPGEGTLTVLTFPGYAEYGGGDPNFNWVTPFEKSTGCRVNLQSPPSGEPADDYLARASFDVVSAPPQTAMRLIAEKKVTRLTTSLIPHYDQIPRWLRSQPSIADGDAVYGVPYLWGYFLTIHDGTAAGALEDGPVMLKDSPMSVADAALLLAGERPELGIKDPFQLTRPQLDATFDLLKQWRGDGRPYWKEPVDLVQAFAGGTARVARALPYQLMLLRGAGSVKASGDAMTGWVDSWMVSARAASPNCAYRWLDWTSTAKVQQQAAVWNGLAPANPLACTWKLKDEPVKTGQSAQAKRTCDAYRIDDDALLEKIHFAVRPTKDCGGRGGECTDYTDDWAARWARLVE